MNQNETRTFWISVGAALFGVFLLYSYTQQKSAQLTKKFGAKTRVVVAAKDINAMQTLDETMLQVVEKPVDFIEPQAVSDPELAVGQVALAPIKKGEQILKNKIMKPGPVTGLALQVAPTKRAITIPIDEMRGVAKLINPGDRIDIVAALNIGAGLQQKHEVKTIMQDVTVLATGHRITNELPLLYEKLGNQDYVKNLLGDTSFTTITIEASPEKAQDLIYILSTSPGSIFLTLRHPSDHSQKRFPETTIETLLGKVTTDMINRRQMRRPASPPPRPVPVKKKKQRKGPFVNL